MIAFTVMPTACCPVADAGLCVVFRFAFFVYAFTGDFVVTGDGRVRDADDTGVVLFTMGQLDQGHAGRQGQVGEVQGAAQLDGGDVHLEVVGQVLGQAAFV